MNQKPAYILLIILTIIKISFSQQNFKGNYSQASERKLELEELEKLTTFGLRIMRNEIYARHGYIFKSFFMNEYFKVWIGNGYNPLYTNVEDKFTELEKENIRLIKSVEDGVFLSGRMNGDSIYNTGISYFRKNSRGYVIRNVSYYNSHLFIYPNTFNFLVKETNDVLSDNFVDGGSHMTTLELYNFDNSRDEMPIYKRIKTSDMSVGIKKGNKLIYQTETPYLGTDAMLCRLVDFEDNQPFALSNSINQIYKLRTFQNVNRWISYYNLASDDWVYDKDWKSIKYKNFDSLKYEKYGTIVYSNEDTIFQMIDIYKTINYNINRHKSKIELSFPQNPPPYQVDFSNIDLLLKEQNKDFRGFSISYHIDGEMIEMKVDGRNITIGECRNENIRIIKRDVSKYKIN